MSELPSCTSEKYRKARKIHKCCECQGPIDIGEKYHYLSGVWEGRGKSYKTCLSCETIRGYAYSFALDMEYSDEGYPPLGELYCWIVDCETTPGALAEMFAPAQGYDDAL